METFGFYCMLENNKILEKKSWLFLAWSVWFSPHPFFPFCYINKIWSSKWKGINCTLASSSSCSIFPNFLLLLSLLKACKMSKCSVGEISSLSLFFAEVEIIPKGEEKTFLHVSFSVSSLIPWEYQELYPCIWQHPETAPLCPQLKDNAQDWGLRGKNNPWGGLGECVALCEASQALSASPESIPTSPGLLSQDALSRLFREFLWRCLSHSRELSNKNHPHFPCRLCVCVRLMR